MGVFRSNKSAHLRRSKGQSSLEALVAFAALISCIALLIAAAKPMGDALSKSTTDSAARIRLSQEAAAIDLSCALSHAALNASIEGAVLQGGQFLAQKESPLTKERLHCKSSADSSGGIHAQNHLEPV